MPEEHKPRYPFDKPRKIDIRSLKQPQQLPPKKTAKDSSPPPYPKGEKEPDWLQKLRKKSPPYPKGEKEPDWLKDLRKGKKVPGHLKKSQLRPLEK